MPENLETLFEMIGESDFLINGSENDKEKTWHINFDWIIKNDSNFLKVLEGNYKADKSRKKVFS